MGYYINLDNSTALVKKEHLDEAYKVACDLNKNDDLKSGGSYQGGKTISKHFAWMDEDYPKTCKDLKAIFEMLGFETSLDNEGNLCLDWYDSKGGDEGIFLEALAPFMEGEMEWRGEDGAMWKHKFENGEMLELNGKVVYE